MFNDLPPEKQGNLELTEQYLVDLVAYHIEQNEAEKTKTEEKDVLDLSEVCTEFLGTNEATAGEKRIPLASLLSAVLKHPELPEKIYHTLTDEFFEIPEGFYENIETIQLNLDALRQQEGEK